MRRDLTSRLKYHKPRTVYGIHRLSFRCKTKVARKLLRNAKESLEALVETVLTTEAPDLHEVPIMKRIEKEK